MKNFGRILGHLVILPLILWLPLKGLQEILPRTPPPASIQLIPAAKYEDVLLVKDMPAARLSIVDLKSMDNPQAASRVIAEYAGESTITIDVSKWFSSGYVTNVTCPFTAKTDLQLLEDGTFILSVIDGASSNYDANTNKASCTPSETKETTYFIGSYTKNPNKLIFGSLKVEGNNTEIKLSDIGGSGTGNYTDSTAEGELVFNLFDNVHYAFSLNIVQGSTNLEASPTPGKGCISIVGNISGLKPGDTLSPSAAFSDPDGKPVSPLSMAWYINSQQTSSITWDGKETTLELQYTCPDHSAHTQNFMVAAYNSQQPPSAPQAPAAAAPINQSPLETFSVTLDPTTVTVVGGVGVLVTAGVLAATVFGGPKPVVPTPLDLTSLPPVQPPPIQSIPPMQSPLVPPTSPTAQPPGPPQSGAQPTEPAKPAAETHSLGEAAKDAAEKYAKSLEIGGQILETVKGELEKNPTLSEEAKHALIKKIEGYTKAMDHVKKKAEEFSEHAEKAIDYIDTVKTLNKGINELTAGHAKMLNDLHDLPPEVAHQIADLSTVLDAGGRAGDLLIKKLPGGETISKAYDIQSSTQAGVQATGRTVKTLNTSKIEEGKLSDGGKDQFIPSGEEKGWTPEMEKVHNEALKKQGPSRIDAIKKWVDWLTGEKHVDPSQLKFR